MWPSWLAAAIAQSIVESAAASPQPDTGREQLHSGLYRHSPLSWQIVEHLVCGRLLARLRQLQLCCDAVYVLSRTLLCQQCLRQKQLLDYSDLLKYHDEGS